MPSKKSFIAIIAIYFLVILYLLHGSIVAKIFIAVLVIITNVSAWPANHSHHSFNPLFYNANKLWFPNCIQPITPLLPSIIEVRLATVANYVILVLPFKILSLITILILMHLVSIFVFTILSPIDSSNPSSGLLVVTKNHIWFVRFLIIITCIIIVSVFIIATPVIIAISSLYQLSDLYDPFATLKFSYAWLSHFVLFNESMF